MKQKNKSILKKPNWLIYPLFRLACKFVAKFVYNLKIINNETKGKKGGYVIIANHESAIDFINVVATIKGKAHLVISHSFYNTVKNMKIWFDATGCIPKQQFQTNASDMRKMRAAVKVNELPLVLYPAGLMTENGESNEIPLSTGKVLKWFDRDVYVAYSEGTYFTKPKWSKVNRKGKVTMNLYKLLSAEDLRKMDESDVQSLVEEKLHFNAYENQERNMVKYQNGDNVEGLENVLYQCPKCHEKYTISVKNKNTLVCSNCHNSAKADDFGFLTKIKEEDVVYRYVSDWSKFIQDNVNQEVNKNPNSIMTSHAKISMINYKNHRFEEVGEGMITLDKNKFNINGLINSQDFKLDAPIDNFLLLPFSPGQYFEIQDGNDIYRIVLDDPKKTVEWIYTLKSFHKLKTK